MQKALRIMFIVLANVVFYAIVVFAGIHLCQAGYAFACEAVGDTALDESPGETKMFVITEADTEYGVSRRLSSQRLIGDPYAFYIRMQMTKTDGAHIQKGIYTLNSNMTYEEMIRIIYGS